jgi:cell wall-associated NlpC family hydrolase
MRDPRRAPALVLLTAVLGATAALTSGAQPAVASPLATSYRAGSTVSATAPAQASASTWTYHRLRYPARIEVDDGRARPVAVFTYGARTVNVRGPLRTFKEPATTSAVVRSHTRVRLLSKPFTGTVPVQWLRDQLSSTRRDVLAVALQYVTGAPTVRNSRGAVASSDAGYGPMINGSRQEGSDFNDYLGVSWSYSTGTDAPESDQRGDLDCSGFVRMVFGYRFHVPMSLDTDKVDIPRRSAWMLASAPGVVTVPDRGKVPSTKRLAPGDLLFFDADPRDGHAIDHVAIYLGRDNHGHPRFVSSRKSVNGPTMGDKGGNSLLSGTGTYAHTWRAVRRI